MTRPFIHALNAVLLIFSLFLLSVNAEPPKELKIFHTKESFEGLDAKVFPIGWTKDGSKLAVIVVPAIDVSDIEQWTLQVIDLTNNTTVLSKIFPIEISDEEGGLNRFWKNNGEQVTDLLKPHDIDLAVFNLHPFPLFLGERRTEFYEAKLEKTFGIDAIRKYQGIETLKLFLVPKLDEARLIFEKKWQHNYPVVVSVIGYIPNPKGDRAAILLGAVHYSEGGGAAMRQVHIIGAQ